MGVETVYNKWIGKITCAYKKDISVDAQGTTYVNAKRSQEREKYIFKGLPNADIVLIECPPDVIGIEFEADRETNERYINSTKDACVKFGLDYCIADHKGKSPWLYLFNLKGMPETGVGQAKKALAERLVPKDAVQKKHLDVSNFGNHLVPVVGLPHWKAKYHGNIHEIVDGKSPELHDNDVSLFVIPKEPLKCIDQKSDNALVQEILKKTTLQEQMERLGFDLTRNPTRCLWHASDGGKSFSYDLSKGVWYCFNQSCCKGGGVIQLIMRHFKQGFGDAVLRLAKELGVTPPSFDGGEFSDVEKRYLVDMFALDQKQSIFEFALFLTKKVPMKTWQDTKEVYYYKDGLYNSLGDVFVERVAEQVYGKVLSKQVSSEILGHVMRRTYCDRSVVYGTSLGLVCLENGVLDLEKGVLMSHSPDLVFVTKVPVRYNPDKKCDAVIQFFKQVAGEDKTPLIQELFGYTLYRDLPLQKAFMLVGEGRNGKSTFCQVLIRFLGRNNVSMRSLQELCEDKFARADLFSKLGNIFADIPSKVLYTTSYFKALTGGDIIQAERKHQHSFQFQSYAKMVFSANVLPMTGDESEAFYRRWVILKFPNKFDGKQRDPLLLRKLLTDDELSGLLNWAIEGLHRLLRQGEFTGEQSIEEIKETYTRLSDSVKCFIKDVVAEEYEYRVEKQLVYKYYRDYCVEQKMIPLDDGEFWKRMRSGMQVVCKREGVHPNRVEYAFGLKLLLNDSVVGENWLKKGVVTGLTNLTGYSNIMVSKNTPYERQEKTFIEKNVNHPSQVGQPSHLINTNINSVNTLVEYVNNQKGVLKAELLKMCDEKVLWTALDCGLIMENPSGWIRTTEA